jgi:drug/metabolite transporter (DMT)-like permease
LIAISASIFYASFLLLVEHGIQKEGADAIELGVVMQGTVGILSLIAALILEHPKDGGLLGLIAIPTSTTVWWMLIFLTILCSAFGFLMQALGQKYTTAERAGVIFAIEPVFAGIVAFLFAGDVLSVRGYIGAGLIIFSLFMMEMDFKKIFGRFKKAA